MPAGINFEEGDFFEPNFEMHFFAWQVSVDFERHKMIGGR